MKLKMVITFFILFLGFLSGCTNSMKVEYTVTGDANDVDVMIYYTEGFKDHSENYTSVSLPWTYHIDIENDEGVWGEEHYDSLLVCVNKNTDDNTTVRAVIKAEGSKDRRGNVSVPFGNLCLSSELLVDTAPTFD